MTIEKIRNETDFLGAGHALGELDSLLFAAMRKLQHAGEVHAKRGGLPGGLTPTKQMILQMLQAEGRMTASQLSQRVSLSAATLSGMLDRMAEQGWLTRERDESDKRRHWLCIAQAGRALLDDAPPLLPPTLLAGLARLADWERHALTAAVLRLAALCDE